jgi:hypothetical protein
LEVLTTAGAKAQQQQRSVRLCTVQLAASVDYSSMLEENWRRRERKKRKKKENQK